MVTVKNVLDLFSPTQAVEIKEHIGGEVIYEGEADVRLVGEEPARLKREVFFVDVKNDVLIIVVV